MKKKVTVLRNNQRIEGAEVQVDGGNQVYNTNGEGEVEVEFYSGLSSVRISHENVWTEHSVDLSEESGPLWFDISEARTTGEFLRQNTLNLGDRFVCHKVLGRGGMGTVIKAEDRVLRRPVAIKILAEELRDNIEAQDIFLSEGRSLAALSHPNLVSVYDVVSVNDRAMMVLEFIDGKSLEEEIHEKINIGTTKAVQYGIQLGRALAYLHSHGIVHRDIKPANLMLLKDGTLKIIDFGLARSMEHLRVKTTQVRGSPAYMAPEQIKGEGVTEATDIYQVGVTLFEIVTGVLPFDVKPGSVSHFEQAPPRPSDRFGGVHPALDELITRCLSRDPAKRPASAEVLTETLRKINRSLTSPADLGGIPANDSTVQQSGTDRKVLLVAVISLILIGGVGFALYTVTQKSQQNTDAMAVVQTPPDSEEIKPPEPEPTTVEPIEEPTGKMAASAASNQIFVALTASRAAQDALGSIPPDGPETATAKRSPAPRRAATRNVAKPKTKPKAKPKKPEAAAEDIAKEDAEKTIQEVASQKVGEPSKTEETVKTEEVKAKTEPEPEPEPEPVVQPKPKPKPKSAKKKETAPDKVAKEKKPATKKEAPVPVPMSF